MSDLKRMQFTRLPLMMLIVFLIACILRWPSCGESFWLDELHTTWCVFGSLDQVAQRAEIGNQQPAYFVAMHAWYQTMPQRVVDFYGIEAVLRLTSVLLTAASAAWLVSIIARASGSRIAGTSAGLALSLDSQAIFFGTELRPYAAIVFLTTAVLSIVAGNSAHTAQSDFDGRLRLRQWIALHTLVLFAAMIHVTSLTVLGPLLLVFTTTDLVNRRGYPASCRRAVLSHCVAAILWIGIAAWWSGEHASLWNARAAWAAFAIPRSWFDLWHFWPWTSLVILPGLVAGMANVAYRWQRRGCGIAGHWTAQRNASWLLINLLLIVVSATLACYLLSAYGNVPLWHRRYLVAALPLLSASMGLALGSVINERLAFALALSCLLLLTSSQGTIAKLSRGDLRLVHRDEPWRSAIALLNRTLQPGDQVWIDAGLIEQQGKPTLITDPSEEEYLRFVTAGPYRLDPGLTPIGVGSMALESWQRMSRSPQSSSPSRGARPAALLTRRWGGVRVRVRSKN